MDTVAANTSPDPERRHWTLDYHDAAGDPSLEEATTTRMTVTKGGVIRSQTIYVNDDGVVVPIVSATRSVSIEYDATGNPVLVAFDWMGDEVSEAEATETDT